MITMGFFASLAFLMVVPAVPGGLVTAVTLGQMTRTLGN